MTSGPGVTNSVTALTDATNDSTPLILLTGNVSLNNIGTNAFQDAEKELLNAKKALADAERATISQRKEVLAAYANWMIADFDESRTWNIVIPSN